MTLGGLKVLLAIVFMQVLAHGSTSGESLVSMKTAVRFHFFRHWEKRVLGHALVLGIAYCCLLIALISIYAERMHRLSVLATALGIVSAFMAILDWFWKLWDRGRPTGLRQGLVLGCLRSVRCQFSLYQDPCLPVCRIRSRGFRTRSDPQRVMSNE